MIIEVGQKLMSSVINVRKVYSARKSAKSRYEDEFWNYSVKEARSIFQDNSIF